MRLSGEEDIEDRKIYNYLRKQSYLSFFVDLRLRKMFVYNIQYFNKYYSENIRRKSMELWQPSLLLKSLAWITHIINDYVLK